MGRSALPSTDRSTVWLADLIEATEVVAASAQPCDPASSAIVCRCPPMFGRCSSRPIWERADRNCPFRSGAKTRRGCWLDLHF
jgi:hypothetical protein